MAQAVRAYTMENAYAAFMEAEDRVHHAGQVRGPVLLDRDLLAVPPAEIAKARGLQRTILGGHVAYELRLAPVRAASIIGAFKRKDELHDEAEEAARRRSSWRRAPRPAATRKRSRPPALARGRRDARRSRSCRCRRAASAWKWGRPGVPRRSEPGARFAAAVAATNRGDLRSGSTLATRTRARSASGAVRLAYRWWMGRGRRRRQGLRARARQPLGPVGPNQTAILQPFPSPRLPSPAATKLRASSWSRRTSPSSRTWARRCRWSP